MATTLHECLTESAHAFGSRDAIIYKDMVISYQTLNVKSGQIAALLAKHKAGKGTCIGIYMDKSPEAVAAIFGALKTGSCYVPLDPFSPLERICYIINECDMRFILTSDTKLTCLLTLINDGKIRPLKRIVVVDTPRHEMFTRGPEIFLETILKPFVPLT